MCAFLSHPPAWPSEAVLSQNKEAAAQHRGVFEMREYTLKPEAFKVGRGGGQGEEGRDSTRLQAAVGGWMESQRAACPTAWPSPELRLHSIA